MIENVDDGIWMVNDINSDKRKANDTSSTQIRKTKSWDSSSKCYHKSSQDLNDDILVDVDENDKIIDLEILNAEMPLKDFLLFLKENNLTVKYNNV